MATNAELQAQVDQLQAEQAESARLLAEGADLAQRLLEENEGLRGQLAAVKPTGEHQGVARRPFLSEGERQELALYGTTNSPFTGERLDRGQVLAELADSDTQADVVIPEPSVDLAARMPKPRERTAIEGVDFVYPSVAPGVLASEARVDPAGNAYLPPNVAG